MSKFEHTPFDPDDASHDVLNAGDFDREDWQPESTDALGYGEYEPSDDPFNTVFSEVE